MAVDVCSEISSLPISPRISFSHDLNQTNSVLPREDINLLDSSSDFNFCILNSNLTLEQLSPADELFSNGKILPVQIKKTPALPPTASYRNSDSNINKKRLKEFLSTSLDTDNDDEKPPQSKSFWQFRRSSSLNFDTARGKSLIRSLQFLSRSNSTGSVPNPKQNQKPGLQKQSSVNSTSFYKRSTSFSSGGYYSYANKGSHGNGVNRVSPVLNLPHPYIPKVTINFFGFGSLLCNGKVRRKKK
ncbi:hypothetical protein L484_025179 [Morus notabilis]|uniref:Uncharacterized protein n=1 Tax=Morus notabilis TaxID=981085 RepID=W9RAS7_9ROSA|nr:uncharacterized protein LOC21407888 [Morus notabilis]EXB80323.1 hypothetical protein L484_025179 [Morus notabilis]